MKMTRVAILLSGGLDSTTALAVAAREHEPALTISVDYGQRHVRELAAARAVSERYGVPHVVIDLRSWGRSLRGSALTDESIAVPHGDYDAENMAVTVVPNRNATFLMAAVGIAQANDVAEVWTAVHSGDHALYADCRPEFIVSASQTAHLGTDGAVTIRAPFVSMSKADIVSMGSSLGAPFELTWSCYEGGDEHCGECGTCAERRASFILAGVEDPTVYETAEQS
ncbi:7-cyano-7-deazaguanine synthase QueC [Microbacterium sp. NPDC012755]